MKPTAISSEENFTYDGSQLSSLHNYLQHGILGDSIFSWTGPCKVSLNHMIDGEDLRLCAKIESDLMLHFIIELFDMELKTAISIQRLMSSMTIDTIRELSPKNDLAQKLIRKGDDIYFDDKKFNVSVATASPLSCLIHFGLNITTKGTPVPAISMKDFAISHKDFTLIFVDKFCKEVEAINRASKKVRWAK